MPGRYGKGQPDGIQRDCKTCGARFGARPREVREGRGLYCSKPCFKRPVEDRFWEKVVKGEGTDDCWLWTGSGVGPMGHGVTGIHENGKSKGVLAHRFSWELHKGPIPDGMCVLHSCDVPACVNPGHLFIGTRTDNMDDKVAKDRQSKGESHGAATITETQVREIRRRAAAGERQVAIAKEMGIGRRIVSQVVCRRTWKHVQDE